jgi:hypothetical protein
MMRDDQSGQGSTENSWDYLEIWLQKLLDKGLPESHILVKSARAQIAAEKLGASAAKLYAMRPME